MWRSQWRLERSWLPVNLLNCNCCLWENIGTSRTAGERFIFVSNFEPWVPYYFPVEQHFLWLESHDSTFTFRNSKRTTLLSFCLGKSTESISALLLFRSVRLSKKLNFRHSKSLKFFQDKRCRWSFQRVFSMENTFTELCFLSTKRNRTFCNYKPLWLLAITVRYVDYSRTHNISWFEKNKNWFLVCAKSLYTLKIFEMNFIEKIPLCNLEKCFVL